VEQALPNPRERLDVHDRRVERFNDSFMSMRLVRAVAETENLDDFHLSRLLILLRSFDSHRGNQKTVEGIMKLAKLDFLVRYPTYFERSLAALGKNPDDVGVEQRERTSIESTMIRFRYGPWDSRYRRWLGLLMARQLVTLSVQGRTIHVGLTERGRDVADTFRADSLYATVSARSDLLSKTVGKMSATKLKDFVYQVFPELVDMKWGAEIPVAQTESTES
jgi:hypothetical protein